MIAGKRVCVVMPAYNAEQTLEQTVAEIPRDVVDDIVLVDDGSHDSTVEVAHRLGLHVIVHPKNRGYGGNQKTCYTEALKRGADIVVMVHPDYQYTPLLIPALASCVASGLFDAALGSRILGGGARGGGMPLYKYVANRLLTTLPLEENDDDFVFDNEMLVQALHFGFRIAEVTCPTRYSTDSSSINFRRSVKYGFGVLGTAMQSRLTMMGLAQPRFLSPEGRKLGQP